MGDELILLKFKNLYLIIISNCCVKSELYVGYGRFIYNFKELK